jgi:hypothetical protein
MAAHDVHSSASSLPGEQDGIRNADLADIVHGRGIEQLVGKRSP